MSVVPSSLPSAGGKNSVSIFGRRVSTDALLLAGASVVAIILLYRSGASGSAAAPQPVGTFSGDGSTLSPLPTNPLIASAPAPAAAAAQVVGDIGGGVIHSAPNAAADVLGIFNPGTPLTVTGPPVMGAVYGGSTSKGLVGISSGEWLPVSYAGGTGYIWAPEAQVH